LVDRHVGGPFRHHDLCQHPFVRRLDLHGRFIGLNLGDDVAGLDGLPFLLEPFCQVALLHGWRERGHEDVDRHEDLSRLVPLLDDRNGPRIHGGTHPGPERGEDAGAGLVLVTPEVMRLIARDASLKVPMDGLDWATAGC
jgi:hypothetical protein